MQPEIPGHEPFKKIWREPQIVITREDIIDYEHSQKANQVQRSDVEKNKTKDECRTTPESLTDRLMDLRNSLLESHIVRQQLQTPKKYCNNTKDSDLVVQSNVSNTLSQDSDWAIPQYSMSKSVPSFPLIGAMPHMGVLPKIPSSQERCLSFLPDRLRLLEETRYVPETDEGDNSFWLSHRCCNSPRGVKRCHTGLDTSPLSPGKTRSNPYYQPEIQIANTQPPRVKRKLDMEDSYSTSVKRATSELSHDAGLRYVNQLEMDLLSLKHRLQYASTEMVDRHANCACAEMEKHFMEMATGAYKSIRRYDGTMNSFEQFKQELMGTNQVIKDSMELLQNVRRLCVH